MTDLAMPDAYAETIAPMTLKIQRVLPGTVERVWAYLTQSDLRRQWLAEGEMKLMTGDGPPPPGVFTVTVASAVTKTPALLVAVST